MKDWVQAFRSVFGAMTGVQSNEQRLRDAQTKTPIAYVVASLCAVFSFIMGLAISVTGLIEILM